MAITSPISVDTPISYLILLFGIMYSAKIEYALILTLCSDIFFYRIPTAIPISPLFFVLPIFNWGFLKYFQLKKKINIYHFLLLTFFVWYIYISCSTSLTHSFDKLPMYLLSVFFIFAGNNCDKFNFELFNKLLSVAIIIVLSYVIMKLTLFPIITEEGRRVIIVGQNGNVLARNIAYFSVACLTLLHIDKKKWLYVYLSLAIICILITGSRTSFYAIIIVAYICSLFFSNNKKVFLNRTIYYVCTAVFLFIIAQSIGYDRVTQVSSEDINNDIRFVTASYLYNYAISRNLWTGIGLGNENSFEILGYVPDADNMYVDILTQLGVIGLVIILFIVAYTSYNVIKLRKETDVYKNIYFPFALILINMSMSMTESIFDESMFYTSIAIAYIYKNNIKKEQERLHN